MLKKFIKNRAMTAFIVLSIAAFSIFAVACSSDPEIQIKEVEVVKEVINCLLYTSDAADE